MSRDGRNVTTTTYGSYVNHLDTGHNVTFTRIYNNHGPVRVKLNVNKPMTKLPSVQQLITQLTKKHEKIRISDVTGEKGSNNIRYTYIHRDLPDVEEPERKVRVNLDYDPSEVNGEANSPGLQRPGLFRESNFMLREREKSESATSIKMQSLFDRLGPKSSSAAPSGPYSSTDIVSYSNDVGNRHISSEEFRHNSLVETDRERKKSEKEKRPNSLNTSPKSLKQDTKVTNIERPNAVKEKEREWDNLRNAQQYESREREKERSLNVDRITLPDERDEKIINKALYNRQNCFKPLGVRNNFVTNRDPAIVTVHTCHPQSRSHSGPSRESDDLVAMGTIWNPNNGTIKNGNNNPKTFSVNNPTATQINVSAMSPMVNMSKKYPTSRISQMFQPSGNRREAEPKYSDPIAGAPPTFQQRLAELASLENDTVRWERTRKFKKKKDSS